MNQDKFSFFILRQSKVATHCSLHSVANWLGIRRERYHRSCQMEGLLFWRRSRVSWSHSFSSKLKPVALLSDWKLGSLQLWDRSAFKTKYFSLTLCSSDTRNLSIKVFQFYQYLMTTWTCTVEPPLTVTFLQQPYLLMLCWTVHTLTHTFIITSVSTTATKVCPSCHEQTTVS